MFDNSQFFVSGGFYNFPLEQSLRFNDDDSAYLTWTPDSAGNRKTWTLSFWAKLASVKEYALFGCGSDGANYFAIRTDSTNNLFVEDANDYVLKTTQVLRDVSAWYHIVVALDTTQATASNRLKIYINGEQVTAFATETYPALDYATGFWNSTSAHEIGDANAAGVANFDGYLAEVNFIDGTALDADSFGELKNGVWIPKDPSGLTYGTNGFRLSFADDAEVEAFNTVLYRGTGTATGTKNPVTGMGFSPDLLWIKNRDSASDHALYDKVRGVGVSDQSRLESNNTDAEVVAYGALQSIDSDGFTIGPSGQLNASGESYVAWGWKAGDSNVSNTDGSITSTVRANTTYGFSIVSFTQASGGGNQTVGHGLSSTPNWVILKRRDSTSAWLVSHSGLSSQSTHFLELNTTNAENSASPFWGSSGITSSTIGLSDNCVVASADYIAYCWAEKAGYSKFGSYEGTGTTQTVTGLGFAPSLVIVKNIDNAGAWAMFDNTRPNGPGPANNGGTSTVEFLQANVSNAEGTSATVSMFFDSDGFTVGTSNADSNASGDTYIYAAFADTREAAFWLDQSGNDNDWQPVNLDHNDTVADSPTDNFATWNPLAYVGQWTAMSDGNLEAQTLTANPTNIMATMAVSSGKFYWEVYCKAQSTDENPFMIGVGKPDTVTTSRFWEYSDGYAYYGSDGNLYNNATGSAYGSSYVVGDTIGVALDMDAGTLVFYKNGVSQGTAATGLSGTYAPFISDGSASRNVTVVANFGQQPFKYDPPA